MGILSLLLGCKRDGQPFTPSTMITSDDQHNEIYERGSQLISPHMPLLDRDPKVTARVRDDVSRGIRDLDAVTAYNPQNWAAFWVKGKGFQVLGDHKSANAAFKASFAIQQGNPDVAREYAVSCLELGYGKEAIYAVEHAIRLTPDDAGLHANLALAFLIDGRNKEAKKAIERSLEMAPEDKISQSVQRIVDAVISGRRAQPKTMADLNRS